MTPAQQTALEALVARPLTPGEIALATVGNHADLAASLSDGLTRINPYPIGAGTILSVMAPDGGLFLATLRDIGATRPATTDTANVAESVGLIDRGTFDIGMSATRTQLEKFAAANPDLAPGITALLALPVEKKTISVFQVRSVFFD